MATSPEHESPTTGTATANGWFTNTHWSVVWAARNGDPAKAAEALNKLCTAWRNDSVRTADRHSRRTPTAVCALNAR